MVRDTVLDAELAEPTTASDHLGHDPVRHSRKFNHAVRAALGRDGSHAGRGNASVLRELADRGPSALFLGSSCRHTSTNTTRKKGARTRTATITIVGICSAAARKRAPASFARTSRMPPLTPAPPI